MGPYQVNMNRPGTTWFTPLTDAGYLNSALINFMDCWHMYFIDEWNGGRPAGTEKWIGEGKLEMATSIAAQEQPVFQGESYPTRMQIQKNPPPPQAMGLGHWGYCGFNPQSLFRAMPEI